MDVYLKIHLVPSDSAHNRYLNEKFVTLISKKICLVVRKLILWVHALNAIQIMVSSKKTRPTGVGNARTIVIYITIKFAREPDGIPHQRQVDANKL